MPRSPSVRSAASSSRPPLVVGSLLLLLFGVPLDAPTVAAGTAFATTGRVVQVAGAFEAGRGRGRIVVGRRCRLAGFTFTARRWSGGRREASVDAGVIDVDQSVVLGDQARVGGEEDVRARGGGVDEFGVFRALARGDQAEAALALGHKDFAAKLSLALLPALRWLPLIDVFLAVGIA